ncbi:ATP cone domain-containing protein [Clostridium tertium]|uniref:ATP cone domain-containing protein n=1 Tax=Clostridium tertium TaxID=1559 RepID=UPI00325A7DA5
MNIVKKDGIIEKFNIRKVKTSIENAARDSGTMVNESDLNILVNDVEKVLLKVRKDSLVTSSYEVIGTIFEILKRDGFNSILRAYVEFDK